MSELRRADLHTHSLHSDGVLTPWALVQKAKSRGIEVLALTDHDCIDGIAEAQAAGKALGVEIIPGVELSITVGKTEAHLLGYFFDPTHQGLQSYLSAYQAERYRRAEQMVAHLHRLGVPLAFEKVIAQAQGGVLARPHLAQALIAEGFVETYAEAFERYLGDDQGAAVAKTPFPSKQALELLHAAGGIGVLAHPGHWTPDEVIMQLVRDGLDGIETIHPSHDDSMIRYYQQLARDFFLLQTGGSDYHGLRPEDEERLGWYTIPFHPLAHLSRQAA